MQAKWKTHDRMLLEGDHESHDFCPHLYFSGSLIENVDGLGVNILILLIEANDLRCWLWLEAVQPVEEFHKHSQGSLLEGLPFTPPIKVKSQTVTGGDGIVEEENRTAFERPRNLGPEEAGKVGITNTSKHEGNVID